MASVARIAVVDDDECFLALMTEVVAERGWELLSLSADSALERIRAEQPDAVLLDLRLPGQVSGWEILQQLSASSSTRTVPIILCSADTVHLENQRDWLAEHDISVLAKPFELDDLYCLLDRILARDQEQRDTAVRCPPAWAT